MNRPEWISLIAFSFFIINSLLLRPITKQRRIAIAAIGAIGLLVIAAIQFAYRVLPQFGVSVARDWSPVLLMPMVYWQAGLSSGKVNNSFQTSLRRLDRELLSGWLPRLAKPNYRWVVASLELAYLSCYVLVPMGLAVLYINGLQLHSSDYWSVVLLATYPCYAFSAFFPTRPPRLLETDSTNTAVGKMRRFNLWIVRIVSTQMNTFPSAHVTATLGSSLVLLHFVPGAGLLFVFVSIGIALGAVLGRYHYAADVVLAAAFTVTVYVIEL